MGWEGDGRKLDSLSARIEGVRVNECYFKCNKKAKSS